MNEVSKKAREIIIKYIYEYSELKNLPEMSGIATAIIPKALIKRVSLCIKEYGTGKSFSIEGFINFRLGTAKKAIDYYCKKILNECMARERYLNLLDDLRDLAENSPRKTKAIYISSRAASADSGAVLWAIFDYMPEEIMIEIDDDFKNCKFLNSAQYIFGEHMRILKRKSSQAMSKV
ncbi:MAG: putative sporulation protein YtxC [Clostridiales bacterium]|jgi:hypothetical protein|nr:putative sporulation protein YtxC [Clostridiales bacterium]